MEHTFIRDSKSNALLNTDVETFNSLKQRRKLQLSKEKALEDRLLKMENSLAEIFDILRELKK